MNSKFCFRFAGDSWLPGLLGFFCLLAPSSWGQQCGLASNFQSTCTQAGNPRQFQCSLQVTPQVPGVTKVRLQAQSGVFNGQSQIEAPIQNGMATFSFQYQEAQAFNPNVQMMVHLLNASNMAVCRFPYAGPVAACMQANCASATANLWLMGGGAMFEQRSSLANYRGPAITLLVGGTSGPNSPNVVRITYEILSAERRPVCNNTPGAWIPVLLQPATAQHGGWNPAVYSTPSLNTAVHVMNHNMQNGLENGLHLMPPADKVNPACSEQYRMNVRVRLTFANGCEVTQNFNNVMANRP